MIRQPKYKFGDKVSTTILTKDASGKFEFENPVTAYIIDIAMCGVEPNIREPEGFRYTYGIGTTIPGYYASESPFKWIREHNIKVIDDGM